MPAHLHLLLVFSAIPFFLGGVYVCTSSDELTCSFTIDTYGLVSSVGRAHVIALDWCTYYYGEHIINVKMCQGNLILVYRFPSG